MTELEKATETYTAAKAAFEDARDALGVQIVEAAKAGMRQVEIVKVTGYTRENVRRICRAAGIE